MGPEDEDFEDREGNEPAELDAVVDDDDDFEPPSARESECSSRGSWFNIPIVPWGRIESEPAPTKPRQFVPRTEPVRLTSFLTSARATSSVDDEPDEAESEEADEAREVEEPDEAESEEADAFVGDGFDGEDLLGDDLSEPLRPPSTPPRRGRPPSVRVSEEQWGSLLRRAGESGRAVLRGLLERAQPCTAVELASHCGMPCRRVVVQLKNLQTHSSALEIPHGAVVTKVDNVIVELYGAGPALLKFAGTIANRTQ